MMDPQSIASPVRRPSGESRNGLIAIRWEFRIDACPGR